MGMGITSVTWFVTSATWFCVIQGIAIQFRGVYCPLLSHELSLSLTKAHEQTNTHTHTHARTHTHAHARMHTQAHTNTHKHTPKHTHTRAHRTHAQTHTHTPVIVEGYEAVTVTTTGLGGGVFNLIVTRAFFYAW